MHIPPVRLPNPPAVKWSAMRAFEVRHNEKKLCLAGIGDDGVLTTIANWVTGRGRSDLFLQVGGLITPANEHVSWVSQRPLKVGDEITVKIVEADTVDEPNRRHRRSEREDIRAQKNYVRRMAKQLGWKVTAGTTKKTAKRRRN